jgi:hypothetical protein
MLSGCSHVEGDPVECCRHPARSRVTLREDGQVKIHLTSLPDFRYFGSSQPCPLSSLLLRPGGNADLSNDRAHHVSLNQMHIRIRQPEICEDVVATNLKRYLLLNF